MSSKPVKMPSAQQIQAFRLNRKIRENAENLRRELRIASVLQGDYGRDKVVATQMNKLSVEVGRALKRGNANTVGVSDQLAMLADQVASQALLLQSLISYFEDDPNFDKARLREIMHNLDAADGEVDGKLSNRKR